MIFLTFFLIGCHSPLEPAISINLTFQIPNGPHEVSLKIYSSSGNLIRSLADNRKVLGGLHSFLWDGKNNKGEIVVEGIYYYILKIWTDGLLVDTKIEKFVISG
jgi:flagellar hook assembly protein FlgD